MAAASLTFAAGAMAAASGKPTFNKAQINAAVQEALKKAEAEGKIGASGKSGVGSTTESPASSGAFSNLTGGGTSGSEEEPKSTRSGASLASSSGSVSTSLLVAIFAAAGLLLAGIAFFIVRDARSVAPAGGPASGSASSRDRAGQMRKRRSKAKAARAQRKRNR